MSTRPECQGPTDEADATRSVDDRIERMARRGGRSVHVILGTLLAFIVLLAMMPLYRWRREVVRGRRIAAIRDREPAPVVQPRTPLDVLLGEALPRWLIALQFRDQPQGSEAIASAFASLRALSASDPIVLARIDRVRDLIDAGLIANADDVMAEFRQWNNALDAAHEPFHLRPVIERDSSRTRLTVSAYRVSFDGRAMVGSRPVRLRLLTRIDRTNMREYLLGHVTEADEGALILTDRVRDAAVRDFWPLFEAPANRALSSIQVAQRSAVLHEAHATLSPTAYETLSRTAPAYEALVTTANAINGRASCGSTFRITIVSSRGVSARDLETVTQAVDEHTGTPSCPAVTDDELDTLIANSDRLSRESRLDAAIGELTTMLTRAVATHEARHASDTLETGSVYVPLPCEGCPVELRAAEVAELSAYLASFAATATGYAGFYQACVAAGGTRSTHGTALAVALERMNVTDCSVLPPADLAVRARAAEQAVFGRSDAIVLPDGPW